MTYSIKEIFSSIIREFHVWQAMRAVGQLDEGALHDIGIDRGNIESAVRGGR